MLIQVFQQNFCRLLISAFSKIDSLPVKSSGRSKNPKIGSKYLRIDFQAYRIDYAFKNTWY